MNKMDPLGRTPDNQRRLFQEMCKVARGATTETVIGAAANLLANALRQSHAKRDDALSSLDALHSEMRQLVASNYDAAGKRRNVFPFDQTIEVPLLKMKKPNG